MLIDMQSTDNTITTKVIKIGNSQGIRIPKPLIEQCGLDSEVTLSVEDGCLTIRPVHHPRQGWEESFKKMAANGDDKLLDEAIETEWDKTEWAW